MPPRYIDSLPESTRLIGSAKDDEIEIIDRREAPKIRAKTGVLIEDKLHYFVRDAVKYPSGEVGTSMRIIGCTMHDGPSGVVALCSRDGNIFLRETFRHATRRWELETPRGQRETGMSAEDAARKEIDEELGFKVQSIEQIGEVSGDTAILASTLSVFWADLAPGPPRDHPEDKEAFGRIVEVFPPELRTRIARCEIRDGYTLAALTLAQVAGKFKIPD
ncbi:MAG TPA: NUDIX hydrolase [Gemmatimonadaceae bacterium]|nr:NUDIX hydrolase [Gemmatimonadaceae bacterium]